MGSRRGISPVFLGSLGIALRCNIVESEVAARSADGDARPCYNRFARNTRSTAKTAYNPIVPPSEQKTTRRLNSFSQGDGVMNRPGFAEG